MVLEQIVVPLVDLSLGLISPPLLHVGLKILAPSWAIYNAPTHLIYAFIEIMDQI
jgi:hypothetical protein